MLAMKTNAPGATAALVCGILAIVLCWFPIAGLVLGIIAIVSANKAKRRASEDPDAFEQGGIRVAGFVCGIVGTALAGIYNLIWISAIMFAKSAIDAANPYNF